MNAKLLQSRVARGVKFLNAVAPGWQKKINLDKLNLASTECCVVGQVFTTRFQASMDALGIGYDAMDDDLADHLTIVFGFDVYGKELNNYNYDDLTREWIRQIQQI